MENEGFRLPTAEELLPHTSKKIKKRKNKIKNFLFGWIEDRYDKLFLLVILSAFIIRLIVYTKTNDQALWWDAADYMASAKRWGLGLNTIDIWYYRRGFLWPLLGAFFFKVGLGEFSIRFFVTLLSTGIVFVTYFLIKEMFNKRLALLTSIGVTFSWVFLFFTGRPLTNLPATFFFLTAVLFFWKGYFLDKGKKYSFLFGLFFALSILTRMQYLMFAPSFLVLAILKEKWKFIKNKGLWIAILIFLIVLIPQLIIHNEHFGNPIKDLSTYYLGIGGSDSGEVGVQLAKFSDLFLYFKNLPYILDANNAGYSTLFPSPFYLFPLYFLFIIGFFMFFLDLFLGIDKIFQNPELQKRFFILFWMITTFLFLGYIAPHLEQRYIMPIIPFLFFLTIYPINRLGIYLRRKHKLKMKSVILITVIIIILLMIPNIKFGFNLIDSKKQSYQEIKLAGEWIKENSNPEDIIVGGSLPQLSYYSERSIYPFHLAYRRDIEKKEESDLDKFILENRPKYFSISAYENEKPWAFTYPQKHQDFMIPVQAYGPSNNQPVLVIYRFDYKKMKSL